MEVRADLEVHSKYARAVSSQMVLPEIARWSSKKGINLVGTGDFTHPMWIREIEFQLEEIKNGIFRLKNSSSDARFLLTSEVSCIYKDRGKGRRVHILIYLPSFSSVHKFNEKLSRMGANLFSDGRPIIGLTLAQVAETALSVDSRAILIPAHVWTPWFGFYGQMSGYDHLEEAFGSLSKYIPAVETGLSSDPAMNWRIEELSNRQIVSFGDAHSPQKLGREATVFEIPEISYENIRKAIGGGSGKLDSHVSPHISYTIEFYPEEGKYHFSGHRKCGIVYSPNEARKMGLICPVCGKELTMGVMSRVEHLGNLEIETEIENDNFGVRWIKDIKDKRPKYAMLVPLLEILSESLGVGVGSQKVTDTYESMINTFGSEFAVLLSTPIEDVKRLFGERNAEAIKKVRAGDIFIKPGYDGVFGKVRIWSSYAKASEDKKEEQTTLF